MKPFRLAGFPLLAMLAMTATVSAQDDIQRYFETVYDHIKIITQIEGSIDDGFTASTVMTENGKTVLNDGAEDLFSPSQFPEFSFFEMDGDLAHPEVYVTMWTGGAHCCTAVSIYLKQDGKWKILDGGAYDGEPRQPTDIDGDRVDEIVTHDNAFLYRFASYAGSFAPIEIVGIRDGELKTVTSEPRYRAAVEEAIQEMGPMPASGEERNSWLAAYAANRLMLGDANFMDFVEQHHDRNATWGLDSCEVEMKDGVCPEGRKVVLSFPAALKSFLTDTGYLEANH